VNPVGAGQQRGDGRGLGAEARGFRVVGRKFHQIVVEVEDERHLRVRGMRQQSSGRAPVRHRVAMGDDEIGLEG
jgi:hypothetical protein